MVRYLRFPIDVAMHGISYGFLNFLIHQPTPLNEEKVWRFLTRPEAAWEKWLRECYPPSFMRRLMLLGHASSDMRKGVSAHYDVSNDFYKLFLDRKFMFYSCADHLTGRETIEEAQTNKANHLLGLIDPQPGEKILELGCGWASMLRHIEQHTGDRENLSGYTLSREQVAYIEKNFGYKIYFENFVTAEYPHEYYDKIYSIGAWEGHRPHEINGLMKKLHDTLKPGGRCVLHFFCRLEDRLPAALSIAQLFFPGHVASSYRMHIKSFEGAGFRIMHTSCHDYRMTLRQWFENMVARRDEALQIVDVKTYNRYVVFFAASYKYFDERMGVLFRFVLKKPPI